MTNRVTRLAPSPTGALHLGNARTFLLNWAIARLGGWLIRLRIEDLDGPRIKVGAAQQALDTLEWLGLDADGEAVYQSHDLEPYRETMRQLTRRGRAFPCSLTRSEIEAALTAPHVDDHELRFPGGLRPHIQPSTFENEQTNYRLLVDDEWITVHDEVMGPCSINPSREVGDFVIWTRTGAPAYQLAVVVDDARQGVTDVIRGVDLLPSAARQMLLYRELGHPPPRWWHLPLVIGPDGRRLAKRHGDTRIETYRRAGVRPERIIGLMAWWSGMANEDTTPREMSGAEFLDWFTLPKLPRTPVTFTERDHRWLLEEC